MKKFYEFLESHEIVFCWIDKNTFGQINFLQETVFLNFMLFVADTILHEYYHFQHPEWTEGQVIKATTNKVNRLSVKEIINIVNKVYDVAHHDYEEGT
jgi:hypothetical protein